MCVCVCMCVCVYVFRFMTWKESTMTGLLTDDQSSESIVLEQDCFKQRAG